MQYIVLGIMRPRCMWLSLTQCMHGGVSW